MEPAQNLEENTEAGEKVPVYRGDELIKRLKEARGVAYYSGHKITPTKKAAQKIADQVSQMQENAEENGMDMEQIKKFALIGLVFVALLFFIL